MKTHLFSIGLLCFYLVFIVSCDNNALDQKDANNLTAQVSARTDCEDCTVCCCSITLNEDNAATLQLCGTEDGASPCMDVPPSGCFSPSLNGGGQLVSLSSATVQRHVFCMLDGRTLRIYNTSSTDGADIILTCQHDSGLPQTLQIHLDPLEVLYYDVDTGCIVGECN